MSILNESQLAHLIAGVADLHLQSASNAIKGCNHQRKTREAIKRARASLPAIVKELEEALDKIVKGYDERAA